MNRAPAAPPSPAAALPRARPSAQGVDAAGIDAFLDGVESARVELHSLMVLRGGHVVAEGWWAPYAADRPHLLYSLSKSFTSTALGFAVGEQRVGLDDFVADYFPELGVTATGTRKTRVRDLAAMASGHTRDTWEEAVGTDPDEPVRGFLATAPEQEPGTVFAYNQPCTYTVAAILQRVTGQTLTAYLTPRLFAPLGIRDVGWQQLPAGRDIGFTGLHAPTEAVASVGQLYLQGGRWEGRQLLPAGWAELASRAHVSNGDDPASDWAQGYGYQFWRSRHGYRGDGAFGQFCVVLPEQDAVVATTAATEDMQGVLDAMWAHLLPAFGRPGDAAADAHLLRRLSRLSLPGVPGAAQPGPPAAWSGRAFRRGDDREHQPTLGELRVERSGDGWALHLHDDGDELRVPFGPDRLVVTEQPLPDGDPRLPVAAGGGWTESGTLHVEVLFLETPHRLVLDTLPDAASFTARWRTSPLWGGPLRNLRSPRTAGS
ncbi:MAG TPA: serine hydrolase domain-containing protein [Dermatophilaceae bacterium]|nr:serine hydrolase domain-containing protein [Dermatophilaceae bacterium]